MSFQTAKKIKDVIDDIQKHKYFLPAIQREFIWKPEQIERLFDSLMQGYPISSFLFWQVEKENLNQFKFYHFIQNFHEKEQRHNEPADLSHHTEAITAVLDGQQRLTSLYIGLTGSYSYKTPYMRWDNPNAFPKRILCLNLLPDLSEEIKNNELKYQFKFLTEQERTQIDEKKPALWFPVPDILKLDSAFSIFDYLNQNYAHLLNDSNDKMKQAFKIASQLFEVIHSEPLINFYLEKDSSLDKVLNIFIRINSGGTILSYSDLLLSFAIAQWKEHDAREEITQCVDTINQIKNGFNINKDFILKSCLVLIDDIEQIEFKVDNFTTSNMTKIEQNWLNIKEVLFTTYYLIAKLGFNRDNLLSNNAIIPIAHYIYKLKGKGIDINKVVESKEFESEREKIKTWIIKTTLKQTFSGSSDSVLRQIRSAIKTAMTTHPDSYAFPLDAMAHSIANTNKSLYFSEVDIDNLLSLSYGKPSTYATLSLLYPHLDYSELFHQDHIFPQAKLTKNFLLKNGVNEEECQLILEKVNLLPNLQLLSGNKNQSKQAKLPEDWLQENYSDKQKRINYESQNYFPENLPLNLENCLTFWKKREELLKAKLKELVA